MRQNDFDFRDQHIKNSPEKSSPIKSPNSVLTSISVGGGGGGGGGGAGGTMYVVFI